jgi:hypothetical protein
VHDFLDHHGAVVVVCMRCGLAEFEPGWDHCTGRYVAHMTELAITHTIRRNPKTGRIMLIERAR